jgi:pimeloyl-ACP methyl ester carboxylesterase
MKKLYPTIAAVTLILIAGRASSAESRDTTGPFAGAKVHYAKFGTNKIHYLVEGKGKHTIVLVHCWSGNLGFWREQVTALTDKARVVLIDLPGHGQSDKPHAAYTMDYFADAVLAVMRDARVDKATMMGHSMGVPVICRLYKKAPERVAALVAVDGALRRPKMPPGQAEQFIAAFHDPDYKEKTRQFMGTMFPIPGTEALRDKVISEMLETPQYVMLGGMEGMFATDQPDWDLQHVSVPVLVINAPNPNWNDEYKDYVKTLSPQTEYRAFEGVGHWLMLEKPAEFNSTLLEMLRKYGLVDK